MNFLSNISRILLLTLICCSYFSQTKAYCSLEKMKKFAMEACEHLFLQDEAREKRSVFNGHNHIEDSRYPLKMYDGKKHYISRSTYPRGGYLKVDREYFHKLSRADVYPKYKPKKLHHDKKERFKRDHPASYNNIPYCCYNRCEDDFFC